MSIYVCACVCVCWLLVLFALSPVLFTLRFCASVFASSPFSFLPLRRAFAIIFGRWIPFPLHRITSHHKCVYVPVCVRMYMCAYTLTHRLDSHIQSYVQFNSVQFAPVCRSRMICTLAITYVRITHIRCVRVQKFGKSESSIQLSYIHLLLCMLLTCWFGVDSLFHQ